jgi:LuxR family maltose regulon positive regulatory protein
LDVESDALKGAPMTDPLVETKLIAPRLRPERVARPRLAQLLLRGSTVPLTLLSAPAGFGKTTLLGVWFGSGKAAGATAWVSLDDRDRDASSFWSYFLLAVDRAAPGTAAAALARLQSGQVDIEGVLAALLNELSVLPEELTVVLDDYHLADSPEVHPGMMFLFDHLPAQVHLVVSTRADPALPLSRLRARGQLVEIRAADLRFTPEEVATYLNEVNALGLSTEDVVTLEARTEGWAAALQLAALSLQGRTDPGRFIAGFAGNDRFVVDYLADEVLDRQPVAVRGFLLETSVLDRLTGPLCEAVTGRPGGRAMLESLERQNLFVVPLDDHRRWYRYHHLFADVLRAHLLDVRPDDVVELHRRASDWYDQAGEPERAVRHALAAGDVDRAADLVEIAIPRLRRQRREAVTRRWVHDLPADIVADRPVLAVGFISAFTSGNEFDGVEERLRHVERLLRRPADDLVVLDRDEFSRLPAAVETYWAALALVSGDLAGTLQHAELARGLAADDDLLSIAAASALMGLASWATGDLAAARRGYAACVRELGRAGHVADVLGCTIALADIDLTQGRLCEAERSVRNAVELAGRHLAESGVVRGTADMYVALSRVAWERGDLIGAAEHVNTAMNLGEEAGLPQNPYRWRAAMAHLRAAEGDLRDALDLLEEAERVYVGDFSPDVRPVAAMRARILAAAGDVTAALEWARRHQLSTTDDLTYLREYEHVTLAGILLADHAYTGRASSLAEATDLLERLLTAAEAGARVGTVIEVLALQALARQAALERDEALASLQRAVRLAEPEGYVSVFAVQGVPMAELLEALLARHGEWPFANGLLRATLSALGTRHRPAPDSAGQRPDVPPGAQNHSDAQEGGALVEPLSERERDVLRFLCSELDGPAIARELSVSLSTVRTHTQHIFTKLGVNSRRAAVRRAHQLGLLSHSAQR